jgi:hypothetical protein
MGGHTAAQASTCFQMDALGTIPSVPAEEEVLPI